VVEEVVNRVEEDPDGGAATDEERLPPPVVILIEGSVLIFFSTVMIHSYLGTELQISGNNCRLHDHCHKNGSDNS